MDIRLQDNFLTSSGAVEASIVLLLGIVTLALLAAKTITVCKLARSSECHQTQMK